MSRTSRPFITLLIVGGVLATSAPITGQQAPAGAPAVSKPAAPAVSKPGAPAARPSKPWTPKRTPDGQPDLQGYWQTQGTSTGRQDRNIDLGNGKPGGDGFWAYGTGWSSDQQRQLPNNLPRGVIDPPDGRVPLLPWAAAAKSEIIDNAENPRSLADVDPHARCLSSGVPRTNYALGYVGYQFMQSPGYVVLYTELSHQTRIIPLDDRPHLGKDIKLFLGDSHGKWEGNTLTVRTKNLRVPASTGFGWLDMQATLYSDQLEVVETYTLVDRDTIAYQAVVTDPKVASRPWTMAGMFIRAVDDYEVYEYACHEGNKAITNIRESIELRNSSKK